MTRSPARAVLALALAACKKDDDFSGTLDTPAAVAILDPALGGPFHQPVGYAADTHGGRIRVLDLIRGTYLADDREAAFLPGSGLATGAGRSLAGIVAVAPDDAHVHVLALDRRHQQLLRIPHVIDVADGEPVEDTPTVAEATFRDLDGSGESVEVRVQPPARGRAAAETWTFRYASGKWSVEGSRSGRQRTPCAPNAPWISDDDAVVITLVGQPTDGDEAVVVIDDASEEIDLPGPPEALSLSPDASRLALTLGDGDAGTLRWVDPVTGALLDAVPLPADARPLRMAWTADGATLFVADAGRGAVWSIGPDGVATEHPLGFPVFDVAVLDGADGRRVFAARADRSEVVVYDPDRRELVDVNVATPGADGMQFLSPIRGMEAIHTAYDLPGDRGRARTVAVSLQDGQVVWMTESRGCLVDDGLGPRTARTSQINLDGDWEPEWTVGASTPGLRTVEDSRHHVLVNPCAGIAHGQGWSLRFDANQQAWVVRAAISGEQAAPLYEDERYLSDRAEVSMVMRSGTLPSEDGMTATFEVISGVLAADGSNQGRSTTNTFTFDLPAEPAVFLAPGWTDAQPYVLVAAQASDLVARIDPRTGVIDALWD